MNKHKLFFVVFLLIMSFAACEKDDICIEGDTAQLVIRFYDFENPTETKAVPALRVAGVGREFTVSTFADRTELDSIAIPLNPGEDISEFIFIVNSTANEDGFEVGNIDGLNFSYDVKEKFLGRACGFIANYENLNPTVIPDDENWIRNIEIIKALVQTEDTLSAHVKIFH